jgi:MerR-like DNA binding protein
MKLRQSQLCKAIGANPLLVSRWISRGYLRPKNLADNGKARNWTENDARRLLLFIDLTSLGQSYDKAARIARRCKFDRRELIITSKGGRAHILVSLVSIRIEVRKILRSQTSNKKGPAEAGP